MRHHPGRTIAIVPGIALCAQAAAAITPADECEAAKLKVAGKYGFCRAEAVCVVRDSRRTVSGEGR